MFGRKRQIEVMRQALLYYANRDTYRRKGKHPKGSPVRYKHAPIVDDHGTRALKALREVERIKPFGIFRKKPVDLGNLHLPKPLALQTEGES